MSNLVNHPPHYGGDTPHEVIKCLAAWGLESDVLLWNAVKYIARAGKKGDKLTDLKKALFYLQRRIDAIEATMAQAPRKHLGIPITENTCDYSLCWCHTPGQL